MAVLGLAQRALYVIRPKIANIHYAEKYTYAPLSCAHTYAHTHTHILWSFISLSVFLFSALPHDNLYLCVFERKQIIHILRIWMDIRTCSSYILVEYQSDFIRNPHTHTEGNKSWSEWSLSEKFGFEQFLRFWFCYSQVFANCLNPLVWVLQLIFMDHFLTKAFAKIVGIIVTIQKKF